MVYTITPVSKSGNANATYSNASAILTCVSGSKAFRNVAVGASLIVNSVTKTVLSKQSEEQVTMNTTYSGAYTGAWTYTNPVIALGVDSTHNTIQKIRHTKSSSPMKMPIPSLDTNEMIVMDTEGVERQINLEVLYAGTTAQIDIMIDCVESLCDGQQFLANSIPYLTTDRPARVYKLYFSNVTWEYVSDAMNAITITFDMLERGM
jgi:hypothetical protein